MEISILNNPLYIAYTLHPGSKLAKVLPEDCPLVKCALRIIFGNAYESYMNALEMANLENLDKRRENLCLKFARKASKKSKFKSWFKLKSKLNTRQVQDEYYQPIARTERLLKGPLSYPTRLLNKNKK